MKNRTEQLLRDALAEDTPAVADMRILAAIRAEPPRRWPSVAWRWAAAAGIAVLVGTGIWWHGRLCEAKLQEDGELMLAIIGMANIDDFTPIRDALL